MDEGPAQQSQENKGQKGVLKTGDSNFTETNSELIVNPLDEIETQFDVIESCQGSAGQTSKRSDCLK